MANYDLTYEGSRVQGILDTGDELRDAGYIFRGEATPSTVPGTPTERVAYIGGPGTYTNFGSSITVGAGCICVFKYTGSAWSNQVINTGLDSAVNTLQSAITAINDNIGNGYVYAGVATPSTSPVTGNVFYLAVQAGTYTNFGNAVVTAGLNVIKYNGSAWSVDQVIAIDAEPTQGSDHLVKSGGVLNSIIQNGPAFDLSAYNAQGGVLATYADLSAALTALNALPADFKKGGMSMKFVLSSDNKYVQYLYHGTSTAVVDFTNVANWEQYNQKDYIIISYITKSSSGLSISDGEYWYDQSNHLMYVRANGSNQLTTPVKGNIYYYHDKRYIWNGSRLQIDSEQKYQMVGFYDAYESAISAGATIGDIIVNTSDQTVRVITDSSTLYSIDLSKQIHFLYEGKDIGYISDYSAYGVFVSEFLRLNNQVSDVSYLVVGCYGYNTSNNRIYYKFTYGNYRPVKVEKDTFIVFDDLFYIWDNGLVQLENYRLNTILFEQGAINSAGEPSDSSKRIRSVGYIYGKLRLFVPSGFTFRAYYYNASTYVYDSNSTSSSDYFEVNKTDCVARLVVFKNNDSDITVEDVKQVTSLEYLFQKIHIIEHDGDIEYDLSYSFKQNKIILDNVSVGTQISLVYADSQGNVVNGLISPCKPGDTYLISAIGPGNRLWTFTDKNGYVLSNSPSNYEANGLTIVAPENAAFVVFNVVKAVAYSIKKLSSVTKISIFEQLNLNTIGIERGVIDAATGANKPNKKYLRTVGYINGNCYVKAPSGFRIRGLFYYDAISYQYITGDTRNVESLYIEPRYGEVMRLRFAKTDNTQECTVEEFKASNSLDYSARKSLHPEPVVRFDIDHTLMDLEDDVEEFDMSMSVPSSYLTTLEKAYAYMDKLVALYPSYLSKYDPMASVASTQIVTIDGTDYEITVNPLQSVRNAMIAAGFSDYPLYAKGVNEPITQQYDAGNGVSYNVTYDVTPEYKTYVYYFGGTNSAVGNTANGANAKKTLFLVGGTHGLEYISQLNACIFTRLLCESASVDYLRLAEAFNFYILPCLNGYGVYHNIRKNANHIDINRNFPVTSWAKNGTESDSSYSGEIPGSEFETRLIMCLYDYISPHFLVDHHSYHNSPTQFFANPFSENHVDRENLRKLMYQACCDVSFTYIKNFADRFGKTPKMFTNTDGGVPATMPIPQTETGGIMGCYASNKGSLVGGTIEIGHGFVYNNGGNLDVDGSHEWFSLRVFEAGEYMLRTTLMRMAQYILDTY